MRFCFLFELTGYFTHAAATHLNLQVLLACLLLRSVTTSYGLLRFYRWLFP